MVQQLRNDQEFHFGPRESSPPLGHSSLHAKSQTSTRKFAEPASPCGPGPCGQDLVVWCQDPVVWCQDPVGQNPVDPVVWCQDPVVWCQDPVGQNPVDPVGQNPVVRNQDPVVWCQDPVVRYQDPVVPGPCGKQQDPVSQNPVVWCQDPVWEGTHRRTLYRVLAHIDKSIQTGSTEPTQAMKES
ncbi:hypothetical protein V8C86DRAFT_3035567 [Haematococcus lacustris]